MKLKTEADTLAYKMRRVNAEFRKIWETGFVSWLEPIVRWLDKVARKLGIRT
jgi:hypothetical protein